MQTDIKFNSAGLGLSGTLYKAQDEKAGVLILAGGANIPHKEGYYPEWQKEMAENAISSFSFDFTGVGESEGVLNETNINSRVVDAKNALDVFTADIKSKNMYVVGVSLGAPVAIQLANSREVSGLALIVPAAYSQEARDKNFGPELTEVIRKPESWQGSPDFEGLKKVRGRIFLAYGTKDDVVPGGIHKTYSEIANGKGGEVLVFKSAGHRFMRETDPVSIKAREAVRERLANFLISSVHSSA